MVLDHVKTSVLQDIEEQLRGISALLSIVSEMRDHKAREVVRTDENDEENRGWVKAYDSVLGLPHKIEKELLNRRKTSQPHLDLTNEM